MAAARWAGVRSPRRHPSRLKIPVGRLDQRVFCGPVEGKLALGPAGLVQRGEERLRGGDDSSRGRVRAAGCAGDEELCGAERLAPRAAHTPRQATAPMTTVGRMWRSPSRQAYTASHGALWLDATRAWPQEERHPLTGTTGHSRSPPRAEPAAPAWQRSARVLSPSSPGRRGSPLASSASSGRGAPSR